MSYTFTSPLKNLDNNESLAGCSEIRRKLDGIFERSKTILIVGWRSDSDAPFMKHMLNTDKILTVVEVFKNNLNSIPSGVTGICADIRDYEVTQPFDLFLWQHGPEHVTKMDVIKFLHKYKKMFKHIILESPNGHLSQGSMYGNPYEEHISAWGPQDYEDLGMDYITYAGPNHDRFIIAYVSNEDTSHSQV